MLGLFLPFYSLQAIQKLSCQSNDLVLLQSASDCTHSWREACICHQSYARVSIPNVIDDSHQCCTRHNRTVLRNDFMPQKAIILFSYADPKTATPRGGVPIDDLRRNRHPFPFQKIAQISGFFLEKSIPLSNQTLQKFC